MRKVMLILVLLLSISCSSASDHIPETPCFPTDQFDAATYPGEVTISILQVPFWEPGYSSEEIQEHILSNIQVTIDGQPVPQEAMGFDLTAAAHPVVDCQNQIIGSTGGSFAVRISTEGLAYGSHTGTIEIAGISGEVHTHSWQFHIGEGTPEN